MYAASSKHVLSLELPVSHRKDDKRTLSDSLTWDGADPVDNLEVRTGRGERSGDYKVWLSPLLLAPPPH